MNGFTSEQLVRYLLPNHPDCKAIGERARNRDATYVERAITDILTNPDKSWENYLPTQIIDLTRPYPNPYSGVIPSGRIPDRMNFDSGLYTGGPPPVNPNTGVSQIQRRMGPT